MDKATPTPSPATPIQVTVLKPSIWMESGMAGDWHIMVQYAEDAPFEYAALFYRYGYTDNATIHRAATEIAVSIGASEPVEERQRLLREEVERLAAQAAPTEPPQEFESAQGRALASAWAEGWAQCRDAEYVGEEAESEAFNQSATLAQCLHADQTRFQGGLSNDELRRAWSAKLPNVIPTDEQLTAFALGIEAAAQPLKAEQAKDAAEDAELLDWLEEKHYALHPIKEDQGDDTYTLWWQVTDKDKSISGHPLGNIRAAIRAARAAERKA